MAGFLLRRLFGLLVLWNRFFTHIAKGDTHPTDDDRLVAGNHFSVDPSSAQPGSIGGPHVFDEKSIGYGGDFDVASRYRGIWQNNITLWIAADCKRGRQGPNAFIFYEYFYVVHNLFLATVNGLLLNDCASTLSFGNRARQAWKPVKETAGLDPIGSGC